MTTPARPDALAQELREELYAVVDHDGEWYPSSLAADELIAAYTARVGARARLEEHQLTCLYCNKTTRRLCDRGRELESAAREAGGQQNES